MKKIKYNSINIFRYFCSLLVVMVHITPFLDINNDLGFVFGEILPRIAVPFFFAVSGYFYIKKLESGEKPLWNYTKKLLITYLLWSAIYLVISIIKRGDNSIFDTIISFVKNFFISGSYYHFWFFPALFFCIFIITLSYKLKIQKIFFFITIFLYMLGCLGCSYYGIANNIPIINKLINSSYFTLIRRVVLMALPFFSSGYLLLKFKDKIKKNNIVFLVVFSIILWLTELIIVTKTGIAKNVIITFCLYLMVVSVIILLLNHPAKKYEKTGNLFRVMANITYYAHPLFILLINLIFSKLLDVHIVNSLVYLLTVLCTSFLGIVLFKVNNKYLNYFSN